MMRTGIEEGFFVFPKPVPFPLLIFLQQRKRCKRLFACKRSIYAVTSSFVLYETPRFSHIDDSTNELVRLSAQRCYTMAMMVFSLATFL